MLRLGSFLVFVGSVLLSTSLLAEQIDKSALLLVVAKYEDVVIQREFDATVEAVNRSTIAAQVSEQITQINFDVDDYVEQGAILIKFNDTKQRARFEQASARLREADVAKKDTQTELERVREIYRKKLVAKATLDKATAVFKSAVARQSQAKARLKEATQQLEQTIVRAPYSGIVIKRHVELGETPSIGQALMTGLSLNQLRVSANVPQQFISVLRQGCCPARIVLPNKVGQRISTKKLTIFPIADSQTHSFKIRVDLEEGQHGLYPGMFVKLELDVDTQRRLMIPSDALVNRGEVTGVYVLDKDKITFRYVKSGFKHKDGRIEIHAGLDEGDRVAADPVTAGIMLKEQTQ